MTLLEAMAAAIHAKVAVSDAQAMEVAKAVLDAMAECNLPDAAVLAGASEFVLYQSSMNAAFRAICRVLAD